MVVAATRDGCVVRIKRRRPVACRSQPASFKSASSAAACFHRASCAQERAPAPTPPPRHTKRSHAQQQRAQVPMPPSAQRKPNVSPVRRRRYHVHKKNTVVLTTSSSSPSSSSCHVLSFPVHGEIESRMRQCLCPGRRRRWIRSVR